MNRFYSILLWAWWTACFVVCLLITTVLYILSFPLDPFRRLPNRSLKLLAWLIIRPVPGWRVDVHGADRVKVERPTLVVANHQSFLDIPLLYLLPWSMKWVTKRGMLRIPILGWLIAMSGHLPIDRQSYRSVQAMDALVRPIEEGIPGMIFPEGTRSPSGELRAFKRGAFMIAKKYNFQVLPVVLEGGHRAMPSGSWKFSFNHTFVISVLAPLDPGQYGSVDALRQAARNRIEQERHNIKTEGIS